MIQAFKISGRNFTKEFPLQNSRGKMKIYPIIPVLILFISCGTVNPENQIQSSADTTVKASVVLPKLPRTQGSDKYANIVCGIVDRFGNLWFGSSAEGLYRFDGNSFTQFTTNNGLSTNNVHSLLEDQSGNIWIGTGEGICKYDGRSISKVPIVVPDPSILINPDKRYTNGILSMLQDKSGKIWFGTSVGMFTYDGTKFSQFPNDYPVTNNDKLELKMVDDMLEDRSGNIWFASGTTEGAMKYDGKSITSSKPNGDEWIRNMMESQQGQIWFGGRMHGVFTYDGTEFSLFTAKKKIGSALLQDRSGNIWFSGEEHDNGYSGVDGVWRYDGTTFTNFTTKDGLGDYGVWCIVEDQKGNIWLGTRNNGLYMYDGKIFTCYSE